MSIGTEAGRAWLSHAIPVERRARLTLGVLAFVVATALGAQVAVRLPFTQVPVTLQPLFVILAGSVLGARAGSLAIATYVLIGAAGAPVFSNGAAGLPWLLGPTGGYLLAMPAAAWVAGSIARPRAALPTIALGLTLGMGVIYVGGVTQLRLLTGGTLAGVLATGVVPFLVGDLIKVLLATAATRVVRGPGTIRP